MIPSPETIAAEYTRLSGVRLRYLSYNQRLCLDLFAKHFDLSELAQVIAYVQGQIQAGKLDARSLSFRNIFGEMGSGNELASFQDRLALAQKTVRVRPEPKQQSVTRNVGNGHNVTVIDFTPEPDTPPIDAAVVAQLGQLKRSIGGK